MGFKESIIEAVNEFVQKPDKNPVDYIDIALPGHEVTIWLKDLAVLRLGEAAPDDVLAIYFSTHSQSRKGQQIIQVIEVLEVFSSYHRIVNRNAVAYYKATNNEGAAIAAELTRIIDALFPTLNIDQAVVTIHRRGELFALGD